MWEAICRTGFGGIDGLVMQAGAVHLGGEKKKEKYGRMKRGELQDSSKKMSLKLVRI